MPIVTIPDTALSYYLIAYDAKGNERKEEGGGFLSQQVLEVLTREPITDIFFMSHGWKGDVPAAREQCTQWMTAMANCPQDIAAMQKARPGFRPLVIGLHWPSLPFGDESMNENVAFSPADPGGGSTLIDVAADRIADTPSARDALRTIFNAAAVDPSPARLPADVAAAFQLLNREAALDGNDSTESEREPFDPEGYYQASQETMAGDDLSFAIPGAGGVLSVLRQLSFWTMKSRARQFGERGAHTLLLALQRAAANRAAHFHLMGHSFGCIVMSALVAGVGVAGPAIEPVHSMALIQGALSLWAYCPDIPVKRGRSGDFASIVAQKKVAGPIITTQSKFDLAVGRWYPLAAGVARQIEFAVATLPRFGAVGAFGIQGLGPQAVAMSMLPSDQPYHLAPSMIYNIESSQYIRAGTGAAGAHSDFAHPEVAHAFWQAASTMTGK